MESKDLVLLAALGGAAYLLFKSKAGNAVAAAPGGYAPGPAVSYQPQPAAQPTGGGSSSPWANIAQGAATVSSLVTAGVGVWNTLHNAFGGDQSRAPLVAPDTAPVKAPDTAASLPLAVPASAGFAAEQPPYGGGFAPELPTYDGGQLWSKEGDAFGGEKASFSIQGEELARY